MKRLIFVLMLLSAIPLCAQQYPPYIFLDANLNPYPNGSGSALGSNPPFALCYTNVTGQPLPCNFSGGGTTTAPLTMNNSGAGAASGTTFDGSVARTISYNTIGAQAALTGTGLARNTGAASELSGDATTSGSNAVTVTGVNGATIPLSALYLASNSSRQLVAATTPLLPANNLSDVANAATARTNLGIAYPETHGGGCAGAATQALATGPAGFGSSTAVGSCSSAFNGAFGQILAHSGTTATIACASNGHAGSNANDGVCTIYLGSSVSFSPTAATCTIGTAYSCIATVSLATTAGQIASCQILPASTGQGGTALNDLTCTLFTQ